MSYESWKVHVRYAGVWTDLTSYVDTLRQPIDIQRGRQTWRDDVVASQLSLALNNADQRFSPGNTTSVYALSPSQEIRVVDVIDGVENYLFHGYLEFPAIDAWQKSSTTAPRDQTITVTAVDRLGRLERAPSFVSTLTEHIVYHGGSALRAYYPLLESLGPNAYPAGPAQAAAVPATVVQSNVVGAIAPALQFGDGTTVPGDDLAPALFTAAVSGTDGIASTYLTVPLNPTIAMDNTQVVTLVAWVYLDSTPVNTSSNAFIQLVGGTLAVNLYRNTNNGFTSFGEWQAFAPGLSINILGSVAPTQQWSLIAARFKLTTDANACELWVGGNVYQATAAAPPSSETWTTINIGRWVRGTIAHAQVYVGAPGDWGRTQFLAQIDAGFNALQRQRPDERIRTLAKYAGLTDSDLRLDTASTLMPAARLARGKAGTLMRAAGNTDNGLLFTSGRGAIVFHGRHRRYNPPLAATVDLTWLEPPMPWRTDPPVNVMEVTSTTGLVARATNQASVTQHTEHPGTANPDTAAADDPANLAAFTTRLNAQPRQRSPMLTFELRRLSTTQRQTVLARELSDRCRLAGLPANAPRGTDHFHIEGIHHVISVRGHRVEWNTGPVLGTVPGVPDPFPRVGAAVVAAETRIPF